jgi:hypothetical protein
MSFRMRTSAAMLLVVAAAAAACASHVGGGDDDDAASPSPSPSPGNPPVVSSVDPPSGVHGTRIAIHGSGFGPSPGGSGVRLAGFPIADFDLWSDAEIDTRVPDGVHAGVVDLVVTVGGVASNHFPFQVLLPPRVYIDAALSPDNAIGVLAIDTGGFLFPITGSPFATGASGGGGLALDAVRARLAAGNDGRVSVFGVDAFHGNLTPVPGSPFAAGSGRLGVAVEGTSGRIWIASCDDDSIATLDHVVATGGYATGPIAATGDCPSSPVLVAGRLYAALRGGGIAGFSDALAPLAGSPYGTLAPTALAAGDGRIYAAGASLLQAWDVGAGGTLSSTGPIALATSGLGLAVSRDGGLVYVSLVDGSIDVYDAALVFQTNVFGAGAGGPLAVTYDGFLLVSTADVVSSFELDAAGLPSVPVDGGPFGIGAPGALASALLATP